MTAHQQASAPTPSVVLFVDVGMVSTMQVQVIIFYLVVTALVTALARRHQDRQQVNKKLTFCFKFYFNKQKSRVVCYKVYIAVVLSKTYKIYLAISHSTKFKAI